MIPSAVMARLVIGFRSQVARSFWLYFGNPVPRERHGMHYHGGPW